MCQAERALYRFVIRFGVRCGRVTDPVQCLRILQFVAVDSAPDMISLRGRAIMMAFNAEAPNSESRPERTVRGAPRPAIFLDGLLMRANSRILVIDGDERMLA